MHLAMDGAGYMYAGDGRHKRIPTPGLLAAVFAKWDCCKPTPSERRALAVALKRAGE